MASENKLVMPAIRLDKYDAEELMKKKRLTSDDVI